METPARSSTTDMDLPKPDAVEDLRLFRRGQGAAPRHTPKPWRLQPLRVQGVVHPGTRRDHRPSRGRPTPRHGRATSPGTGRGAPRAERVLERAADGDRHLRVARCRSAVRCVGHCSSAAGAPCHGSGSWPRWWPYPSSPWPSRPAVRSTCTGGSGTTGRRLIGEHRPRGTRESLEGIERGSRFCTFVDGLPRQAVEAAVLIGAVLISGRRAGRRHPPNEQLNDHLPTSLRRAPAIR